MIDLRREWWVAAVCLGGAGYFVFVWVDNARPEYGAFDLYWEYYPNMVYAARQLWRGEGLLWNPLQSCGQPFFGNSSTGLLYPPNWFFFILPPDTALLVVTAVHHTIAGVGAYLLGRELGARPAAALCGALAFQLGNEMVDSSTWMPMVNAPIAWLPLALWCAERALRAASRRHGIGLGVVLALALLNGFPQPVLYGYQVIGLRVVWELVSAQHRNWRGVAYVLAGLVLAPLLAAIHFIPGAEMAALSVRDGPLTISEILGGGALTWQDFRHRFGGRQYVFNPIATIPFLVALASPFAAVTRRVALFYGAVALVSFALAFGPATPLFEWYLAFPLNRTFRVPGRLLWVTGLSLAALTALGAEHLLSRRRLPASRVPLAAWLAAGAVGLHLLSPSGLRAGEWLLIAVLVVATLGSGLRADRRALAVVAAVALGLMAFRIPSIPDRAWTLRAPPSRQLLSRSSLLTSAAPILDWLRRNMTPHERAYIMEARGQLRLIPKTASLFGFRSIHDYEPAPTRRSAEYHVMMRTGAAMENRNQFYFHQPAALPLPSLLNLAATRYLLIDSANPNLAAVAGAYRLRYRGRHVELYENPDALPRAFYVPHIVLLEDAHLLLERLTSGAVRPTQAALVEALPPSGFVGDARPVKAPRVEFVRDAPEEIVLRVKAPRHGFVHLADQYFPGWQATVNGSPTPILRVNFLFRLIEVPAGESTIELRYRPRSLWLGAAVSSTTVLVLIMGRFVHRRRFVVSYRHVTTKESDRARRDSTGVP